MDLAGRESAKIAREHSGSASPKTQFASVSPTIRNSNSQPPHFAQPDTTHVHKMKSSRSGRLFRIALTISWYLVAAQEVRRKGGSSSSACPVQQDLLSSPSLSCQFFLVSSHLFIAGQVSTTFGTRTTAQEPSIDECLYFVPPPYNVPKWNRDVELGLSPGSI